MRWEKMHYIQINGIQLGCSSGIILNIALNVEEGSSKIVGYLHNVKVIVSEISLGPVKIVG